LKKFYRKGVQFQTLNLMRKLFTFFVFMAFMASYSFGQDYKVAAGLRFGYPLSLTGKFFLNEKHAIEAMAGRRGYSYGSYFTLGGLYQIHSPIKSVEGLKWYVGGGAAAYMWSWKNSFVTTESSTAIGLLGVVGLDYKIKDVPLSITADWMPTFFINGYGSGFAGGYGGLGVRYVFK
jgi:hypothetical protein